MRSKPSSLRTSCRWSSPCRTVGRGVGWGSPGRGRPGRPGGSGWPSWSSRGKPAEPGHRGVLVLAIETSTPQTAVALGNEQGIIAATVLTMGRAGDEVVMPAITHLLEWSDISLSSVSGVAVGLGPGLFTGMRVGIAAAKTLAQLLQVPIAGLTSLDVVAFSVRYSRRLICAVVDAKRGEVFHAFYLPVPGGIARQSNFEVASPEALRAELEARPEDILLVGNGALVYRRQLQEAGNHVDFASA